MSQQTWVCHRFQLTLKATIDVPLLGLTIAQYGDGQLDDSLMPVGWPLHIGAVKQYCLHRDVKLQELSNLLKDYDMKRELVAVNPHAAQWKSGAIWNKTFMEARGSRTMRTMWQEREPEIKDKVTNPTQVFAEDIAAAIRKIAKQNKPKVPASDFVQVLGTANESRALRQSTELARRAGED